MNIYIVSDVLDFFYYCFILNFSLMCFTSLIIYFFTDNMYNIHSKLGFYSGDKDSLTVYTTIVGLASPDEKLKELMKLGDMLK